MSVDNDPAIDPIVTAPDIGKMADLEQDDSEPSYTSSRVSPDALKMIRDAGKRAANGEGVTGGLVMADLDSPIEDPIVVDDKPAAKVPVKAAPVAEERTPPADRAAAQIAQWDAVTEREKAIEARETALREREARYGEVSERIAADPLGTLRDLAKQRLGATATESEIDGEVGYLLTDMSMKLAKVEDDPKDVQAQLRKIRRELDQRTIESRRATQRAEAEAKARAEEHAAAQTRARNEQQYKGALEAVKREFAPLAESHPFLALEDGYEEKIFQIIKQDHDEQTAKSGPGSVEIMTIADAAKHLEDALAARDRERFTKRQHLLQPSRSASANAPADHQGGRPVKARSLTQADASEDAPPPVKSGIRTREDDRAETLAALGPTFRKLREAALDG